jgi:predicted alternative tryptophan synthase beta-subunit
LPEPNATLAEYSPVSQWSRGPSALLTALLSPLPSPLPPPETRELERERERERKLELALASSTIQQSSALRRWYHQPADSDY